MHSNGVAKGLSRKAWKYAFEGLCTMSLCTRLTLAATIRSNGGTECYLFLLLYINYSFQKHFKNTFTVSVGETPDVSRRWLASSHVINIDFKNILMMFTVSVGKDHCNKLQWSLVWVRHLTLALVNWLVSSHVININAVKVSL